MFEQLFGSRTRVKILSVMLKNPDEEYYVRELTRKLGEQINSVRRELANLQSIGMVKSKEKDHRLYYHVNRRFPYFVEFQRLFEKAPHPEAEKIVAKPEEDELTGKIRSLGNITFAMLSGAFLKKQSVVDIFLVGDINKVKLSKLVSEFEREMGKEINFTVMTTDEYYYRRSLYDRFLGEVLDSDKIVLIDQVGATRRKIEESL
jgi:predicted transcriptional regulator